MKTKESELISDSR